MCGIVGVIAHGNFETKKEEKLRQEAVIFLTSELLQLTQARGKDATGVATLFEDGDYMGLKMGVSAQEFVTRFGGKETDYDGYLNVWRKKVAPARISIGHCRKPSTLVGAGTEDNKNNHPIKVGDIVGIHNGTLDNYEKIFENLKCGRDGKVDSEAIFRLLNHFTKAGTEPFSMPILQETCKRLGGQYAVLTFNGNNPYQLAAFRDGRPMEFALIKSLKLLLIASEKDFLKIAITRYNKMSYLYMTGAGRYTPLKKNDIEIGTTIDDSAYLFDATQEITEDTKLADIYITEKIPRSGKIWGKEVASAANNWGRNTANSSAANGNQTASNTNVVKKTEVTANSPGSHANQHTTQTTTKTGSTEQAHRIGMAWNRSSFQFESVKALTESKKHCNVEMDIETMDVVDVETRMVVHEGEKKVRQSSTSSNENKPIAHESTSRDGFSFGKSATPVDDLVGDPAKIEVIPVAEPVRDSRLPAVHNSGVIAIHKGGHTTTQVNDALLNHLKQAAKVVNFETHPDILERAVDATRDEPNFSSNAEMADALEIKNNSAMEQMALYSLGNRIKKFFFKRGWYAGYLACKAEMATSGQGTRDEFARNMLLRTRTKARSAAATIRTMKTLTRILSRITGDYVGQGFIHKAIEQTREANEELDLQKLHAAFKPGDLRDNPTIEKVMKALEKE